MTETVYTVDDLAVRWQCCTDTIYTMIRDKKIKVFMVGSMMRISPEEVHRYENQ